MWILGSGFYQNYYVTHYYDGAPRMEFSVPATSTKHALTTSQIPYNTLRRYLPWDRVVLHVVILFCSISCALVMIHFYFRFDPIEALDPSEVKEVVV